MPMVNLTTMKGVIIWFKSQWLVHYSSGLYLDNMTQNKVPSCDLDRNDWFNTAVDIFRQYDTVFSLVEETENQETWLNSNKFVFIVFLDDSSSDNTGVIAGAVVGSVVGVALIGTSGVFVYKKFYKPGARVAPQPSTSANNPTRAPVGNQPTATHFDSSQYQSTRSSDPPPSYNDSIGGAHPV